jgi:hypothetical protein
MNIDDWLNANRKRQLDTFLASFRRVKTPPNKAARMSKSTNEKSWTRREYEIACRHCRREEGEPTKNTWHPIPNEIWRAADYSYQAATYSVSGWISDRRYNRFMVIKWRILTQREELPF